MRVLRPAAQLDGDEPGGGVVPHPADAVAPWRRLRVLIAEDAVAPRAVLKRSVEEFGHEVVVASDGERAWELLSQASFDIVISDWMMPLVDGEELCRRVRSQLNDAYVYFVMLTSLAERRYVVRGMHAGVDDYLVKPVPLEALETCFISATRVTDLHRRLHDQQRRLERQRAELAHLHERLQDAFSRFIPERVARQVIAAKDNDVTLGGVERDGTVLFADLRGFTKFSERHPAKRVIDVVNRFMSEMTDAVMEQDGTLVTCLGDGLLAVFGAPVEQPDHAQRALAAAREMYSTRLTRVNDWLAQRGFGHEFRMGIGINSGALISGNVGSERRLSYTVVGDTVNTAARIEALTKELSCQLLVSEETRARLESSGDLIYVDRRRVRGRVEHVELWSLASARIGPNPLLVHA